MKKLVFIFLLIAGTAIDLSAQNGSYFWEPSSTTAENMFNRPRPGKARTNFHFFNAADNIRITLELVSIKQVNHLPNLDSILVAAKSSLKLLADSLKEDGIVRRIDVSVTKAVQMRIVNHNERPPTFNVQNNELSILKTESDTLRVRFYAKTGFKQRFGTDKGIELRDEYQPGFITIIVNNFKDLEKLPDSIMTTCAALLKQDITESYVEKAHSNGMYTAYYNVSGEKRFSPSNTKWIQSGKYRNELVPNINGSVQFVRGSLVPSLAAGLRFSTNRTGTTLTHFYLMWEPYFFFSRDAKNSLITDRNDFITARIIQFEDVNKKEKPFEMVGSWAIGYLAGRRGEWFEKNTFKVGLPGVRSGWLQLEPEFYFNNFVKNFSPTLKLTLHYE